MGQANIAYVERRYEDAVPLLLEVIRLSSSSFEPYHTLGLVYEESGQFEKAFSYYLLAAHLSKGDSELWAKLTGIAVKLGKKREVIYCLSKFMHITKMKDPLPFWIRSRLYLEISSYHNVIFSFGELLRHRLNEIDQFQAVAKLALKINLSASCAKLFRNIFKEAASNTSKLNFNDVTWSHLNLLLELYAATKDYDGLISAVEEFAPLIHGSGKKSLDIVGFSMGQTVTLEDCLSTLPIDLKVKLAIAHIHLKTASPPYQIDQLLTELDHPDYGDLRLALGDALYEQSEHLLALYSFLPLMQHYQYGDTKLCIKIAECYKCLGQIAEAVETLTAAAHLDLENNQVRLALSEIYRLASRPDLSAEILKDYVPSATGNAVEPDLDPERIYAEVFGPTDVSLLYEDEVEDGVAESNADGETLLNFPYLSSSRKHPALRQIRRRARKVPHMRYADAQIEQAQSDFNRAKIYYDLFLTKFANGEPAENDANTFISISTKRMQDLVDNPHLRSEFKFRGVSPEIAEDLGSLHGLRVDEWFAFLWMHLIILGKSGSADNALRLLRNYFLTNSAFSRDALFGTKLRFLHVALAKAAGKDLWALVGTRWFLAAYPNQSFPSLLNLACLPTGKACSLLSVHPQNYRPLLRNARMSPSLFFTQITHGHIAMASLIPKDALDAYERALQCLEERDDSKWIDKARIRTLAANAMLHLSFRRTCPNPKILLAKAFSILMYNYQEALAKNPEHLSECLYNMARCFQMSGLLAKSEPLYRKLLDISDAPISIRRAAAHNLHLIYYQAGNFELARSVLACNIRF
jgi:general transcription factor 3C polypeptide 3 (transcription factor C subunit 4)